MIAELETQLVGFVSAYLRPDEPSTLFVWQIAVAESVRGQGLGKQLLNQLLSRPYCRFVDTLETTITESNQPSWRLFGSLAQDHGVEIQHEPLFEKEAHFAGQHDTEIGLRIGPLSLRAPDLPAA